MESFDTELASQVLSNIIDGAYSKGRRLPDARLFETRNVPRTPVRLALRLPEREGVVSRGEGRG